MEDPEKTEVEYKESRAINNGSEKGSNELSQQGASVDIASGEAPETESISLLKERENEESLECSHETKSEKTKKKKRKKKKAKMTNVAPDNTEQIVSTSASNVDETNAEIDSASKGQTSRKECEELDPAEDSATNKKKKKKKKKKTESKVCDALGKQLDNQDGSSAPKGEKSVEDHGDLAVVKNQKQENDGDAKSPKEFGDAVSSGFENERETLSGDSPADTVVAQAEGNAPAPEKEDGSSSGMVLDEVKLGLALENQLDNQDIGSAPKEEKSVEDHGDLAVVKNEKQENHADTKSQTKCGDAVSHGIANDSENLSGDPTDMAAASTEEGNVPAPEKEDRSSLEMVPDEVKPELATMSHGAKESDSDTDMPEEEDGIESDSADNLCDEPDSEGRSITMEDPEKTEVEYKESRAINNGSEKGSNELSQQGASVDIASGEAPETESISLLKERENEESLECSHETKSEKTKKKKRKKKKAKMTNVAPDNTEQIVSTSASNVDETNAEIDSASKGQTSRKECEELDPAEDSATNKKKKKKKKKETESKVCDALGKQLDNQDGSSAPKGEKSVEDQGDLAVVKNQKQENDGDAKSPKEFGDAVSSGFENERETLSGDSPADTVVAQAEGNAPAPEKEDGSSSGMVLDEVKLGLALENQLDNQDIGSAPKEEKSVEDHGDLAVVKNEKQENHADTKSQTKCGDAVSRGIANDGENLSGDPTDMAAASTEEGNVPAPEKEDRSSLEMVPDEVKPELATMSHGAKESDSDTDMPEEEDGIESDSADDLSDEPDSEGRNILCIFKLLYGVGLRALRKLFMDINPGWSNQPSDAAGFDKWKMKLGKDEEAIFNNGNINEWDFTLMTTVLLFSKRCAFEISKRPGYNIALQELKKHRNKLLGHPSTEMMSDADFNHFWPLLKNNFIALGADSDDIAEIKLQSEKDLHAGGYYKQLFLTEQANRLLFGRKLESMENKLDVITEMIANKSSDFANKVPVSPKDLSGSNWDEWLRFCDAVGDFNTRKNQYILVADVLSPENQERFSILRRVAWKMVLDFDPMSEEKGFYHSFTSQEGQGSLVSMITPAEVKGSTMVSLARQIDPNKIQWLFVNGRSSDTAGKLPTFSDWEASSVKEISRFFGCCCDPDKFDKQKPVVCLILPLRQESSPYLEVTLSRLFENFDDQFSLKTVSFKQQKPLSVFGKVKVRTIDMSPELVHLGLKDMLTSSSSQRYRMPTSQAKVPVDLSEKEYLYLREHLEILYEGCEELPEVSNDPSEEDAQLKNFLNEHRRLFMSGNEISFASLYDNHDAKREIEKDIQIHVQRLLDNRLTRSMMVEIKHSPGTGGTTIARRVMWDLHKAYPCAFIEIGSHLYFDEDNSYASKLADRIAALEEICHTSPVVLIDGKQSRVIDGLSNKLVRMLGNRGKRALLLRCQHGSKTSSKESQESPRVHQVFYVDVKLEDSVADLNEFHSKYKDFIERSLGETPVSGACRVFHFPLLAMMQTFRPKLKKIIDDTWNEMKTLQQEIAVMVAFLQKYANQPTPALLIYDAFKRYIRLEDGKNVTYEDIKQLFSEHLLNLMVPSNPLQRRGRMYHLKEPSPQQYTFQHRLVAEMLLKKCCQEQSCDLFQVVSQFLQYPISQRDDFLSLFEELFVYNKDGQRKRKFSFLFEELKAIDQERAAQVFREAAVKTGDSVIFASAARFFAKMEPPSFPKAMELIEQAFQAPNAKQRFRSVCHTKGVVLYIELQHMINNGKVKDLKRLEELANRVLEAYKEARNFPPTYPSPLIGEVDVWLACIGWIMKNKCGRDSEKTLKFLANQCPPFFRTCVSDSFYLLDIVDRIVQSVPSLPDPEETQRKCNDTRLSLMKTFGTGPSSKGRGRDAEDVVQACQALCSAKNFPKSSALELKRLQAQFIFYSSEQIDSLKQEHLEFLLKLLEELVLKENEHRLAYHLMKVCVLVTGKKRYSLEQGLIVCDKWSEFSYHDCLPYFYQMAICFLKILDGHAMEFTPKYLRALKLCREKSQNNCRSSQSTLFVSKEGEGMSRLVTRSTLFRGESDYSTDISEKVTKFWLMDSRKKLLECRGRIRVGPSSDRGKTYPYIELLQGKVDLYVGKNADIGKVDRDFTIGQLVYFVVSFNLQGPVANGITFSPRNVTPH